MFLRTLKAGLAAAALISAVAAQPAAADSHLRGLQLRPQAINPTLLNPNIRRPIPMFPLLAVEPTSGWPAYCRIGPNGGLEVKVSNRGTGAARDVNVRVSFQVFRLDAPRNRETVHFDRAIRHIPAGGNGSVVFGFPRGCFNANCHFSIQMEGLEPVEDYCLG